MTTCSHCRYWKKTPETLRGKADPISGDMLGNCHRYPPALDQNWVRPPEEGDGPCGPECDYAFWVHPLTTDSDWCGEFSG
jgi:hypothetical protein